MSYVLSIIYIGVVYIFGKKQLGKLEVVDTCFSYFLLFNVGISYLYNFVMHVFFGERVAQFIGWAQSPFQLEIGFASLGFGLVGVISFWSGLGFRAATVIAPAFFFWCSGRSYLSND